jgi:hypothetical protein
MQQLSGTAVSRRHFIGIGASLLILSSCRGGPANTYLDISLYNYLDRAIFDVDMNGAGFMGAPGHGFYGSNAVMLMQPITLGPQIVTWRLGGPEGTPRNGERVVARNNPMLRVVPKDAKWLALHIYDDDTVEIKLSTGTPDELETERGRRIIETWEKHIGR